MIIRLYNLNVSLEDDFERALKREASKRLGSDVSTLRLVKRGVDARERTPRFNCTVDVELPDGADRERLLRDLGSNAGVPPETPPLTVEPGNAQLKGRVVVVGSGPAGGFAAYVLALNGYKPLLIERGKPALERLRQIGRWKAMRRHLSQVRRNCEPGDPLCRPRQRQALLHWAYDSRGI